LPPIMVHVMTQRHPGVAITLDPKGNVKGHIARIVGLASH